jgi:tRNA (cytidine/uridine-2'-O-)-methyltransferase
MLYEPLFHVVLYSPQIPPNTGNIGRTCVAIGAKLWLIKPLGFDVSEKARRRAGLDYWEHLEWEIVEDWPAMQQHIAPQLTAGRVWFFTKHATQFHTDVRYQAGDVFVFGSEPAGLPVEIHEAYHDQRLRIPMRKEVRSLNLAVSAGIAVYEALRQVGVSKAEFGLPNAD